MKVIGLVTQQHKEALESLLDPDTLLTALGVAGILPAEVKELSINIANPEFDIRKNATNLAGAICISGKQNAGFVDFTNSYAEMLFITDERRYWDLSPTNDLKIEIGDNLKEGHKEKQEAVATGINQITFVRRLTEIGAEISHEEFSKRWIKHAPLAKEHHPGIARYTQNHVTKLIGSFSDSELADFDGATFDGVAELFFNSLSEMKDGMQKDETSHDIIFADIAGFLDIKMGTRIYATQHLLIANPY